MLYIYSKLCKAVCKNCHNCKASFKVAFLKMSSLTAKYSSDRGTTLSLHIFMRMYVFMRMYRSTNEIFKNISIIDKSQDKS